MTNMESTEQPIEVSTQPDTQVAKSPDIQVTKSDNEPFNQEIEKLKATVSELAFRNLVNEHRVPDRLVSLLPRDLAKAHDFLESDTYKSLLADLNKITELEKAKAELESKLESVNHPQKVEATPIPTDKTEPAKRPEPKKWADLTLEDLSSLGSVLLNQL